MDPENHCRVCGERLNLTNVRALFLRLDVNQLHIV